MTRKNKISKLFVLALSVLMLIFNIAPVFAHEDSLGAMRGDIDGSQLSIEVSLPIVGLSENQELKEVLERQVYD